MGDMDMFHDGALFGRRRTTAFEDFAAAAREAFTTTTTTGDTVTTNIRETARAQLQRNEAERQRLLRRLELLDQFGEMDPWENETVIFFRRKFDGTPRTYTYVALKIGGLWFVTGSQGAGRSYNWQELVEEHLAKSLPDELWVASEWARYEDV